MSLARFRTRMPSLLKTSLATPRYRTMGTDVRPSAKIKSLDHLVLTVASIDATTAWYKKHLGMQATSFKGGDGSTRHGLLFGSQKINLHEVGKEFEPKAAQVQAGSADLCFLTDDSVDDVYTRLKGAGIGIDAGGQIVARTGAVGGLRSVYIRDPDGNLIEISNLVD